MKEFISLIIPPKEQLDPAWWFLIRDDNVLVQQTSSGVSIPRVLNPIELGLTVLRQHYLGRLDECHCYAAEMAEGATPPQGMNFEGLRKIYGRLNEDLFALAGRALQIIDWDRTHGFCGRCGSETRTHATERAKECQKCGLLHFPRLAPAIIVLVRRDRKILLARARRFTTPMYSTLAGFVEPGETLEEAVMREVKEESGITVKDIHYFGSQPWPFPHSLMIGFTANYASGQIALNDEENIDVGWFTPGNLPLQLPSEMSIARMLIDSFLRRQQFSDSLT